MDNKLIAVKIEQTTEQSEPENANGIWTIIMVDDNGSEQPGTEFNIAASTYRKSYANNPLFKVKKKHKQ